jgi:peptidoglycan/xylan/chitin deacetylase (PgdA/CDA1 family)
VLRNLKLSLLRAARASGTFRLVRDSAWRRGRLLILCYHGISLDDEHEWAPGLFLSADTFARRLELLRRGRYNVLPLDEAVRRLADGTLPRRSVAITFDDGNVDFHARAWPLLREYGMPATVYLTSYYAERNLPVFPLVISYVLWKRRGVTMPFEAAPGRTIALDTRSTPARHRTRDALMLFAQEERLPAGDRDALAERLAEALDVDYALIRRRRMLHIMTPDEVREVAAAGIDVQLHTHRHRSPLAAAAYRAEVAENRERIATWTHVTPRHFCYPSGVCMPQFAAWLREEGVVSATTCAPGLASAGSEPLALPRLLDHADMTPLEFEAWLSGIGALLPHRAVGFTPVDAQGNLVIGPQPRPTAELELVGELRD